jgi:hypothetical protein
MPLPLIPVLIIIIVTGTLGAALMCWHAITDFMLSTLLPWLDDNMPSVAALAREVFIAIDKVTVPLIQLIRSKWKQLKAWIVKQLYVIERTTDRKWIQRTVMTVRKWFEAENKWKEITVTKEEEIRLDDLPEDVREQLIRQNRASGDLMEQGEKALEKLELEAVV